MILLSILFLLFAFSSFAQTYPLGYCSVSIRAGVGEDYTEKVYELGAAIQLDTEKLSPLVGGNISAIKIGMLSKPGQGEITTSRNLKVFIRSSLTGEDLYSQHVDTFTKPNGWLQVELNTPFHIDGKELFVGYSLEANNIPLGFDNLKPADGRASWVGINGNWQSYPNFGNASIYAMVTSDKFIQRKVLLEHFTTAACINCPPLHAALEDVLGDNENVIWVAHHSGYLSDSFTTTETEKYLWFFNGETYAPAIMFDRTNLGEYGVSTILQQEYIPATGPVFFTNKNVTEAILPVRLDMPAFVTVNIEELYNNANRELTVTVSGKVLIPGFLGKNTCLNVFLTENSLVGSQSGGGNKYVHNRVMRGALSDAWGDAVTFDSEGNYSKTYKKILKNQWIPANMNIVAFLSNYNAKDPNDCQVYNTTSYALRLDPTVISSVGNIAPVDVYSDCSGITIDGKFTTAVIYNAAGSLVGTFNDNRRSQKLDNGVYIVKVVGIDNQISIKKIVVGKV